MIAAILGALLFAYLYEPATHDVSASTICDRATAIAYAKSLVGKKWDVDNHSYDCVDLIKLYMRDVGGMPLRSQGNACVYATSAVLPAGWTRKYVANGYTPRAGDACAWWSINGNKEGHVAIVVSVKNGWMTVVEQSTTLQCAAKYGDYSINSPTCFICPDFENIVVPTQPTAPPPTEPPTTTPTPTTAPPPTTKAPCVHVYNSGVVTKEATCQRTGVRVYTCTKCGAQKQETIPKTDHDYSNYQPIDEFSHKRMCDCGLFEEGEHVFDSSFTVQKRNCEQDGIVIMVCSVCGATKTEVIPMYEYHEFHNCQCIHCDFSCKRRNRKVRSIEQYMAYLQSLETDSTEKIAN